MSSSSAAAALLARQLREMQRSKDIPGISCGLVNDSNVFEWEVMLMINDDCKYYGGASSLSLCPKLHTAPRNRRRRSTQSRLPRLTRPFHQEATSAPT